MMYSELATCMDSEGDLGVQTPNPSGKSQSYIGILMDTGVPPSPHMNEPNLFVLHKLHVRER